MAIVPKIILKAIDRVSPVLDRVNKKFKKLGSRVQNVGKKLRSFGKGVLTFVGLPLLAFATISVKAFADFEQGLKGVQKTTDISGQSLIEFGDQIDRLTETVPVGSKELLGLAQVAGQLGVRGEKNILRFTETIAKLGRTTNIQGEDAALSILRILTVTGEGAEKVDQFGAALVELGNNFAATESEIVRATTEVARGTAVFGVSSAEAAALGTALSAVGVNAEAGGTVITNSFIRIRKAIDQGGRKFQLLQKITGLSGDALKKNFKEDAVGVFKSFLGGLNRLEKQGISSSGVLDKFGLTGARVNKVIAPLADKGLPILIRALDTSAKAFEANTALEKEFQIQTDTLNARMTILNNKFTILRKIIGNQLQPVVDVFIIAFEKVINFFRENPKVAKFIVIFAGLAVVVAGIAVAVGGLIAAFGVLGVIGVKIAAVFLIVNGVIAGIVTLFDQISSGISRIVDTFSRFPAGLLKSFGIGAGAFGPPVQGPQPAAAAASFKGEVNVNFSRVPKGTRVSSSTVGPGQINTGVSSVGDN